MILSFCDNSTVLSVFRIVKIVIKIITIIVPLILIVSSMISLIEVIKSDDKESLSKSLKNITSKSIAAILIFLIPTFLNVITLISGISLDYTSCYSNATTEGIENAKYNEASNLVNNAEKNIRSVEYKIALNAVNKLKDGNQKRVLLSRLESLKKKLDLKEEIDNKFNTGTEEDYNRLLSEVNQLEDSSFKSTLLEKLSLMKKRIDEQNLANVSKVLSNITSYSPIKKSKNISLNYYVSSSNQGFSFWLYVPDNMTTNMPIVFFMHDLGCRGDDYHNGTDASVWGGPIREIMQGNKKYEAILVHAQVPIGNYSQGYSHSYVELLNKLADGFKANKKKISVMGFSNGCYGVWSIVNGYQNYFSAAVPIGCSSQYVNASIFKTTPMWSLVGSGDGAGTLPGFADTVNSINGNSKHSNSKFKSHNCLYPAPHEGVLLEYDVVEWMISQTRS